MQICVWDRCACGKRQLSCQATPTPARLSERETLAPREVQHVRRQLQLGSPGEAAGSGEGPSGGSSLWHVAVNAQKAKQDQQDKFAKSLSLEEKWLIQRLLEAEDPSSPLMQEILKKATNRFVEAMLCK